MVKKEYALIGAGAGAAVLAYYLIKKYLPKKTISLDIPKEVVGGEEFSATAVYMKDKIPVVNEPLTLCQTDEKGALIKKIDTKITDAAGRAVFRVIAPTVVTNTNIYFVVFDKIQTPR